MGHKLGQLVSLNLSLDTKGSKKWKLLLKRQQWPQISEIEDPKREKQMLLNFSLMKDIEKKMKLTFWNSAKSKLADFGLSGDDFSSFSEDISDGWFVTRCYNSKPKCFSCIFVKFCNDQNQTSAFRLYRDSDFWWNEIKSVNLICLLHTSWIQLLQNRVCAKVEQIFSWLLRTKVRNFIIIPFTVTYRIWIKFLQHSVSVSCQSKRVRRDKISKNALSTFLL